MTSTSLSGTLPATNAALTAPQSAPGTAATTLNGVQGAPGGVPVPGSVADGGNITLGAKADAAYSGSGSASLIAIAKALYSAATAPTPAGANLMGSVKVANSDGSAVDFTSPAQVYMANTSYSGAGIFSIPQSGFSNPQYLDSAITNSTGFDISQASGVSVSFEGTFSGVAMIAEQTNDSSGVYGWTAVEAGPWTDDGSGMDRVTGTGFYPLTGYAWVFPVNGVRMRFRITAITSGTVSARVGLLNCARDFGATTAIIKPTSVAVGCLTARVTSGTAGVVKSTVGQLYGWEIGNTNANRRYLQLYAKSTTPVVGTDTPIMTIPVAASGDKHGSSVVGVAFASGIGWAITTDAAGATAAASGDLVFTAIYL